MYQYEYRLFVREYTYPQGDGIRESTHEMPGTRASVTARGGV